MVVDSVVLEEADLGEAADSVVAGLVDLAEAAPAVEERAAVGKRARTYGP